MALFGVLCLSSCQSPPINWALHKGNGNTLKKRRRNIKEQTDIDCHNTVTIDLRTVASLLPPLSLFITHYLENEEVLSYFVQLIWLRTHITFFVHTLLLRQCFFAVAQGQKCSACSRMYVPESLWPAIKEGMVETRKNLKVTYTTSWIYRTVYLPFLNLRLRFC